MTLIKLIMITKNNFTIYEGGCKPVTILLTSAVPYLTLYSTFKINEQMLQI